MGSSRHVARESTDRTRSHAMNRPVREVAQTRPVRPIHRPRPESRSSNVSKQRSRCGSVTSSPMVRQRRVAISHEFTTGMAGVINQFTQQQSAALEEQKMKYHKYIKRLKRDIAEDSGIIARQISQIETQTSEIKDALDSKEQLSSQLSEIEAKLGASEDRARRLEEKYRACKTHLNSAIQEQQDLYTRSKKQWGEAIEQVEEKEADLSRERESVRALSKRLQDLQATSSGFEALAAQGKEILQKIGEQQIKAEEQHQKSAEGFRDRLDAIATRLEALTNLTSGQPDALAGIRQAQDESLHRVTAKLDNILGLGDTARETTSQLSADLELHMGKVWQRLDNQLESLSKQLAEKAEENGMVSTLYKRKDAECEGHMKALTRLRETTEKQADRIQDLEANLAALDAAQDDENEVAIRRLEVSEAETARLMEELESKTAAMSELQSRLEAKERAYASELQDCSSNIYKLAQTIQERDRSSGVAAQQAAEAGRREVRAEMERANEKTERVLQETQQQRDSLVGRLERLKQIIHEKEQNESRDAATIRSLQDSLATEKEKGNVAAEQLAQRSIDLRQLESQLTSRTNDLEAELKAAKDREVRLEGEGQSQRARCEALLAGLRRWAQHEGLVIDGLDCLSDGNKSAEEISAGLARALRHLERSPTITPDTHPGNLLLADENSKSFLGQSGQLSQADPRTRTGVDEPLQDDIDTGLGERTGTEGDATKDVFGSDPVSYASTLHHLRRVVVRSPANVPNEPAAPSIDQEKVRRREGHQPKSIMKRATRSTSSMLRKEESEAVAGHGAFKRSRQDETHPSSSSANGLGNKRANNGTAPAPNTRSAESTAGAPARRPSKRRRSDTADPDDSISSFGNSGQVMKREASRASAVLKTEASESKHGVPTSTQQRGIESRHSEQPSTDEHSHGNAPVAARNFGRNSGVGSLGLHRAPSANTPHILGSKQPIVRTYGSQRAAGETSTAADGYTNARFLLRSRSQSQSRYWARPKDESQESITFSQGVGAGENMLLPFQG
ncbi:hypothetical protein C8A00DRAFT_45804 [Chaetomidium leptoderma]|uniref:Uncharacterized protein n=1 Tax=Chaetomidium leptoderma TaxID=669021 RepID=A0AAN6ZUM1_9PEZI|nr:hypothetical protein C8A00DRAFT_45804 [Chaetomidium leptoderma]